MKEQITKKEVWDYLVSLESHELHFFSAMIMLRMDILEEETEWTKKQKKS